MNQSRKIKVVGIDPSLRNWGLSKGTLDMATGELILNQVSVINPVISQHKQVRQSSLDLESAYQLYEKTLEYVSGTDAIFVEVPVGSQSARAMASYGICVGILGSIRASGIPFFEVTPTEVKMASTGIKTASKAQMITWATAMHPEVKWPTAASKAEHMADATAAIYAGVKSNTFQQMRKLNPFTQPYLSVA